MTSNLRVCSDRSAMMRLASLAGISACLEYHGRLFYGSEKDLRWLFSKFDEPPFSGKCVTGPGNEAPDSPVVDVVEEEDLGAPPAL